jgi:hypothetical protein
VFVDDPNERRAALEIAMLVRANFSAGVFLIPGCAADHQFPQEWDDAKAFFCSIFAGFGFPAFSPEAVMSGVTWTNGRVAGQVIKKTPQNLGVIAHTMVNAQRIANQFRMCNTDGRVCKGYATFGYQRDRQWTSSAIFDHAGLEEVINFNVALPSSREHWSRAIISKIDQITPCHALDPSPTRHVDNMDKLIIKDCSNNDVTDAISAMSKQQGHIFINRNLFPITVSVKEEVLKLGWYDKHMLPYLNTSRSSDAEAFRSVYVPRLSAVNKTYFSGRLVGFLPQRNYVNTLEASLARYFTWAPGPRGSERSSMLVVHTDHEGNEMVSTKDPTLKDTFAVDPTIMLEYPKFLVSMAQYAIEDVRERRAQLNEKGTIVEQFTLVPPKASGGFHRDHALESAKTLYRTGIRPRHLRH